MLRGAIGDFVASFSPPMVALMDATVSDRVVSELVYDFGGAMLPETGLSPADLAWLAPRLEAARAEVLGDLELWHRGGPIPAEKDPLDAGFMDLPERLLNEYQTSQPASLLGRVLERAGRLRAETDRVVILGIGGSYMGPRALFAALCHPYHNERSRQQRGGTPRIYFEGNNLDGAAVMALVELLRSDAAGRWALVVISKSGDTLETAVAFRVFLKLLQEQSAGPPASWAERVVAITGEKGTLRQAAQAMGCVAIFPIPRGVGGRYSIFSPVGLFPAALMGLDVVRLLEGAAAMNRRFRTAPPGQNPVLDYAGVVHLMEVRRRATIRVLATWGKRLEAVGLWYDQLLAESLGKDGQGATPITAVNTRDLHSRAQQHQQGRRDKFITNLYVSTPGPSEAVPIGPGEFNGGAVDPVAGKTFPELLQAALLGTNQAYREDRRPTADLRLPRLDEAALGELFQMLMLATVVEGRLIGINPYGQPGVEAYKRNMKAILEGSSRG